MCVVFSEEEKVFLLEFYVIMDRQDCRKEKTRDPTMRNVIEVRYIWKKVEPLSLVRCLLVAETSGGCVSVFSLVSRAGISWHGTPNGVMSRSFLLLSASCIMDS